MSMRTRAALGTLAEAILAAVEVNLDRLDRILKARVSGPVFGQKKPRPEECYLSVY